MESEEAGRFAEGRSLKRRQENSRVSLRHLLVVSDNFVPCEISGTLSGRPINKLCELAAQSARSLDAIARCSVTSWNSVETI
jgi:hypothetical protein